MRGVLIASGDADKLAEYNFSSSAGDGAEKWKVSAVSKDARISGTEAMRSST